MDMNIIEKEFFNVAIKHDNMLLYTVEDGVKLIERCKKLNIPVRGFEVFKLYGPINQYKEHYGAIRPNMELEWPLGADTSSLDMWEETKKQLLQREYLCKNGYFFDIFYDTDVCKKQPFISIGLDYISEEFSSISVIAGKRLLFKFNDAKKVIKRCYELNLPVYGVYPNKYEEVYYEGRNLGRFLNILYENEVYYGLNWFEINTWQAALQYLDSLDEKIKNDCIFEIDYHNYGTIHVPNSKHWQE